MRSIELFTGGGGLALGAHMCGFHHAAVIERDDDSCLTLRYNIPPGNETTWPVIEADVTGFDYGALKGQPLDLLAGGAPCQPFSLGGKHAGQEDRRNMFPEVFRAVRQLHPKAVILENVKGLLRQGFRPYFNYIVDQLRRPTVQPFPGEEWEQHRDRVIAYGWMQHDPFFEYDVQFQLYNAADFGVPQERHRVFIVAFRRDLKGSFNFPVPTHSEEALLYAQYVDGSYWDEHHLPHRSAPERIASRVSRLAAGPKPLLQRWQTVRDAINDLPEPIDYDRYPPLANHVGIPDARIYPGHNGSPWDWPAKAIKAGDHGNPGGENMLRRDDGTVRYFTVRELARIQTFPDSWIFPGSWTESRRQLGNAVPVLLAQTVAGSVMEKLKRVSASEAQVRVGRQEVALVGDD